MPLTNNVRVVVRHFQWLCLFCNWDGFGGLSMPSRQTRHGHLDPIGNQQVSEGRRAIVEARLLEFEGRQAGLCFFYGVKDAAVPGFAREVLLCYLFQPTLSLSLSGQPSGRLIPPSFQLRNQPAGARLAQAEAGLNITAKLWHP